MGSRVAPSLPSFARDLQVLLVDRNSMFLAYMTSMLQHYSYKVTTAKLASVALSMIREQNLQFNLVIADVDLPEMDIISFLRLLRDGIPVILTSSVRDLKLTRKCLAEGATFFLEKPISRKDIKYLWQHVYRKMKNPKNFKIEKAIYGKKFRGSEIREENMQVGRVELKRKCDEEEEKIKKNRRKAVLKMMNTPSLTLHQVANHLQKYKSRVQSINTKYQSKVPSSKQPHGSSQVGATSLSSLMGVKLNQEIPSPVGATLLQTMNENSENGGCNANNLFGLQPEICAEKQNEDVEKGIEEDQILAGIEKADGGDSLDCSLNQMQTLEGNTEEINGFGSEHNWDVDGYCEWLTNNLFEQDKDQAIIM